LLAARGIVDAAMAEADRRGISKAAAVVTDFGGDIRAALRADGAGAFGVDTARGKAQAALGFGISSLRLAAIFGPSASSTIGINAATGGRFVPIGGGVLVLNSQGHVIGAAAVSGGAPEVDDEIITLAVRAAGLQVQE
jgi:glc operon protein GlcG